MYKDCRPLFLVCETPLHAGSGADLGIVDLPIQRERHTSFPKIEGSSLKGAMREALRKTDFNNKYTKGDIDLTFGPEGSGDHAGSIGISDARLLLFPIKSVKGVFAWITCPKVLRQFERDMQLYDSKLELEISNVSFNANQLFYTNEDNTLCLSNSKGKKVVLEEYTFNAAHKEVCVKVNGVSISLDKWLIEHVLSDSDEYRKNKLEKDILLVSDDDFKDFVNLSTEVITRNKVSAETGTVASGQLWTEEYLPAESILYSMVMASPIFLSKKKKEDESSKLFNDDTSKEAENILTFLKESLCEVIQIGGNATIGKGLTRVTFFDTNSKKGK